MGFPGDLDSKESAAMRETQVHSLDQEELLEKEIATHSSIFAWRIHAKLQSVEPQIFLGITIRLGRAFFKLIGHL